MILNKLNGILCLLKKSIIFGEVIIRVNMFIIDEMRNEKLFYFIPSGGICSLNSLANINSFLLVLQTLSISSTLIFV